jgi:hypothetical protein
MYLFRTEGFFGREDELEGIELSAERGLAGRLRLQELERPLGLAMLPALAFRGRVLRTRRGLEVGLGTMLTFCKHFRPKKCRFILKLQ